MTETKKIDLHAKRPVIIAGPCSAETEEQTLATCTQLAASGMVDVMRAGVWKPRTKPGTFEGVGLRGLAWLSKARDMTGLPFGVEVATSKHVESALEFGVDMVWIGARTTVSPFAVQDIADALRGKDDVTVLVKNPVNPDLDLWGGAVERLAAVGIDKKRIGLVHRGFSYFGGNKYRNAPMWHLVFEMRARYPELAMLCDPSHIAGKHELVQEVSQAAADLRYDGLIIESHTCPEKALSDAAQQLRPMELIGMLNSIQWRKGTTDNPEFIEKLEKYRGQIDQLDSEVFDLLSRRMRISEKIGEVKRDNDVAILQGDRWNSIVERVVEHSAKLGLSEEFLRIVLDAVHTESINRQNEIMNS